MAMQERMRRIPAVDALLARPAQHQLLTRLPRDLVVAAVRGVLADLRPALLAAVDDATAAALLEDDRLDRRVAAAIDRRLTPSLRPVLNATGVVIHTNLGRAPLGAPALAALHAIAAGYSNLEYDLAEGGRGSRHVHVADLFRDLTGAEAALVVNNNAAAVLLILTALAKDREVVVSRGELIEIGGSFRLPDVMAMGGARLREVGTTNRTRAADYEGATGPETALLLKAHRSNFAIVGFTESPTLAELVAVGRRHGVPVVDDLGSGSLVDLGPYGIDEPVDVAASVAAGADLVCFSGDKLLGGPQCGIILGRRELVDRLKKHPMTRALRVGKLTIAALEATVRSYVDGTFRTALPAVRALTEDKATLAARARALHDALEQGGLPGAAAEVVAGTSAVGGGTLPLTELPTSLVALRPFDASEAAVEVALREGEPPVVARVSGGRVLFDVRTVDDEDVPRLAGLVKAALLRAASR